MDWNRKVDIEDYHPASEKDMVEISMDLFSFFKIYNLHPLDVARLIVKFIASFSAACENNFSVVSVSKDECRTNILKIVSDEILNILE